MSDFAAQATSLYGDSTPSAAPAGSGDAASVLYGSPSPARATPTTPAAQATPASGNTQPAAPAAQATTPAAPDRNFDPDAKFMTQEEWDQQQAEEAAAAAAPLTVEQVQEAVVANIPDAIREQREADEARRLFSPQVTFKDLINFEMPGMDPEASKAAVAELRELVADIGFNEKDIPDLARAVRASPPQTPEQIGKAWDEMATLMNSRFGQDAKRAFDDARTYVAADPRRAALLAPAGFDAKTIVRVAELARAAKAAGRI